MLYRQYERGNTALRKIEICSNQQYSKGANLEFYHICIKITLNYHPKSLSTLSLSLFTWTKIIQEENPMLPGPQDTPVSNHPRRTGWVLTNPFALSTCSWKDWLHFNCSFPQQDNVAWHPPDSLLCFGTKSTPMERKKEEEGSLLGLSDLPPSFDWHNHSLFPSWFPWAV